MSPMTELDVAKGIQASIAGLDLDHPHAREKAAALGCALLNSLANIKQAEWDAEVEAEDSEYRIALAPTYPLSTIGDAIRMVKPA